MQISQSSYSPGNFPNRSAGRNLPSSRSVCGNRNTTTCPACFIQKPPVSQRGYIKQAHPPRRALQKIMIKKPNPVFPVVRLSSINIEQSRAILPEKNAAIIARIGEFFRQVSWLLLHHFANHCTAYPDFTPKQQNRQAVWSRRSLSACQHFP